MGKYITFSLINTEPLRISDDETSQHGQSDTLCYIPGSSIRGMVFNKLYSDDKAFFEHNKKILFSEKIHFANVYPEYNGDMLLPSLKGFYEDKTEREVKELRSIIKNEDIVGLKRAGLGSFCAIENTNIKYFNVSIGEDLNINTGRDGKRNVFRSQYIKPNQYFRGYIWLDDSIGNKLADKLLESIQPEFYIGKKKSNGYGRVEIKEKRCLTDSPFKALETDEASGTLYMLLLSDMSMLDETGMPCGLNVKAFGEMLGSKISVEVCSTSVKERFGYNRVWKGAVPSVKMYQAGSVFKLVSESKIDIKKLKLIQEKGIGIRKNEGFGQVLFIKDFENIRFKERLKIQKNISTVKNAAAEALQDMLPAARELIRYRLNEAVKKYLRENTIKSANTSSSQWGVLNSMCQQYRYAPSDAKRHINEFAEHIKEKNEGYKKNDGGRKQDELIEFIEKFNFKEIDSDKEKKKFLNMIGFNNSRLFGFEVNDLIGSDEVIIYKLNMIIDSINYRNREAKNI